MDDTEIGKSGSFCYLRFIIQDDNDLIEDATNRIKITKVRPGVRGKGLLKFYVFYVIIEYILK